LGIPDIIRQFGSFFIVIVIILGNGNNLSVLIKQSRNKNVNSLIIVGCPTAIYLATLSICIEYYRCYYDIY